ncbi:MAG: helix-turn-helix domain-containing protein [Betaproteobacteria bacterium]|nr:helix-turn-helix domain-containing protein [Betaproteobacteria bacterium]
MAATPLKLARKKAGKKQEELAAAAGVSQAHISCLENLTERASPVVAEKIAAYLGRDLITEEQILYPERFMEQQAA